MKPNDLIDKPYPIKNEKGEIVSFKNIKSAIEMESHAGYTITLDDSKTGIFIGYLEALKLMEGNK